MDPESVDALKRVCGLPAAAGEPAPAANGAKVRLHIEGLASPMRAKIKDSGSSEVRVGSDLGFLQVGKAARARGRGQAAPSGPRASTASRSRSTPRRTSRSSS